MTIGCLSNQEGIEVSKQLYLHVQFTPGRLSLHRQHRTNMRQLSMGEINNLDTKYVYSFHWKQETESR